MTGTSWDLMLRQTAHRGRLSVCAWVSVVAIKGLPLLVSRGCVVQGLVSKWMGVVELSWCAEWT